MHSDLLVCFTVSMHHTARCNPCQSKLSSRSSKEGETAFIVGIDIFAVYAVHLLWLKSLHKQAWWQRNIMVVKPGQKSMQDFMCVGYFGCAFSMTCNMLRCNHRNLVFVIWSALTTRHWFDACVVSFCVLTFQTTTLQDWSPNPTTYYTGLIHIFSHHQRHRK